MLQIVKEVALVGIAASTLMFSTCVLKVIIDGMRMEANRHTSGLRMALGASLLLAVSALILVA